MNTNRLIFQNIDQSFSVGVNTALQGATVIKASKGTNYPQLINQGDTATFLNLFGAPSSTYPGVQEALDYLNYYSLWVSAPGGSAPALGLYSYYGGVYFTTLASIEPFYHVQEDVTGKPSVNFLTSVSAGDGSPLSAGAALPIISTTTIVITNIPTAYFNYALVNGVVLNYTRMDGTIATVNMVVGALNGGTGYFLDTINPLDGTLLTQTGQIDFAGGITIKGNTTAYYSAPSNGYQDLNFSTITNFSIAYNKVIVEWIYNIQSYVIMALFQNSPRTTIGTLSLSNVNSVQVNTLKYPTYTATLGVGGGTTTIPANTSISFTFCGISYTGSVANAINTPTLLATAIKTIINLAPLPPGYTSPVSGSSPNITVTYNNSVQTPTLILSDALIAAAYITTMSSTFTIYGAIAPTAGNNSAMLAGFPITNITATGATAIITATAIVTYFNINYNTSGYLASNVAGASATITLIYSTTKTKPTMTLISGYAGISISATTSPIINNGTGQTNYDYNTVNFNYSELGYTGVNYTQSFTMSPSSTQLDASGQSQYAGTILNGNNFLGAICYKNFYDTGPSYVWGASTTSVSGTRTVNSTAFTTLQSTYLPAVLASGWNMMTIPTMQNVNMFFDPECDLNTATTMAALRSSSYPFSTFITGIKSPADGVCTTSTTNNNATSNLISLRSSYPNTIGLAYYCNEFLMSESYNSTQYYNIPTGSIAAMLTQIMDVKLGGVAPMFTNEGSPSLGGQLSKGVISPKYTFSASNLDALDASGLNPIIKDNYYGLMMTSQRTAQSPITLTDWSYLGHQMSFDLFEAQIKQNVMIPQIGKMIDAQHMKMRREQVQIYLNMRLTGPTAIWNSGQVDVETVNTPQTLAQNNFMIRVRVKVTPFSEYVTLVFNNVAQTSSVTTA